MMLAVDARGERRALRLGPAARRARAAVRSRASRRLRSRPGSSSSAAALLGPVDDLSDASLSWHMVQHLALISLAAPLLLMGAPVRLALAALPPRGATRSRAR